MDGKSDDVIGELQAQLRDSQAQIARERLANKELALRLQAQKEDAANAKALLEALRHGAGDASSPSAALSSSLARSGVEVPMRPVQAPAPSDLSSYQRVIAAVARGKELSAAVRFEASFCHLGQGVAAFLTSLGLAGALLPFPEPPLEPAPLVDSFYIAGPSLGELARALRACRRAAAGTSSPQALTPSVLLCLTSAGAAGGVVPPLPPDAAAQYCFPEGCTLSALPSAAQSVGGGFSGAADRFVGAGAAVSSRRGPRSHVFVVNGGASERGADADAASEAAARAGRPVNGRTRYGVCLQLPVPLTLPPHPSASSSAGSGGASDGPPLSARTASAYAAPPDDTVVVVPLSFCVVSRYPFFPLLFDAALACQTAWWAALVPGLLAALPGPGGGLPPRGSGAASGSDEAHSDEVRVAAPTAPRRNSDSASQAHSHPLSLAEGISVTAPAPAWKALLQRGLTTVRLLVPPTHAPTLGSGAAGRSDPESSSSKGTPRRQSSEPPPATASPGDTLSGAASLLKGFWRGEGVPGGSAGSPAGAEGEPLEADPGADAAVSAIRGALAFPALRELALSVMNAVVPAPGATLRLHLPRAARSARGVARPATDGSGALRYERPLPFPLDSFRGGPEVGGGRTALQMAGVALRALSGGGGTLAALHAASSVADLEHLSWPSDPPESSALPPAGVAAPPSPPRWLLGRDFSHAETWAAAVDWAAPVLFSVLPVDSVLLLVGAALTEHSIVLVGGELSHEALSCCVLALACLLQPLSWVGGDLTLTPAAAPPLRVYASLPITCR